MKIEQLNGLFQEQIRDLHSGETQILSHLPDMIAAAGDADLRGALEKHLDETRTHRDRLEKIAAELDFAVDGHTCEGIQGILAEGSRLVGEESRTDEVRDAAIIAAAQRIEHYEIAGYGTARTLARTLGLDGAVPLLQDTLDEEAAADAKLTEVAESHVNRDALSA